MYMIGAERLISFPWVSSVCTEGLSNSEEKACSEMVEKPFQTGQTMDRRSYKADPNDSEF